MFESPWLRLTRHAATAPTGAAADYVVMRPKNVATGVLPIALGEATKLTGRMLAADKAYDFTVAWGAETSTDDAAGEGSSTRLEKS